MRLIKLVLSDLKHFFLCSESEVTFSLLVDIPILFQTTYAPSLEVDVLWAKYFEPKVVHKANSRSGQSPKNQSKDNGYSRGFRAKKIIEFQLIILVLSSGDQPRY